MKRDVKKPGPAPLGVMRRRDFLIFGGATLAGLSAGRGLTFMPAAQAAVGGPLALYTWQGYELTEPFKKWRAEHGIEQSQKYINNQFDVVSILKGPGGKEFDSSSGNQAYIQLFQKLGLTAPISAKDVAAAVLAGLDAGEDLIVPDEPARGAVELKRTDRAAYDAVMRAQACNLEKMANQ